MLNKLKILYHDKADYVHEKILELLDTSVAKHQFSEKDIVLIVYADHVQTYGKTPLSVLKTFLDTYAKSINTVHILPFYPFSSDRGFSVMDYYKVNPEYGSWDDIHTIKKTLMFDLVLNHASVKGQWFLKFIEGDEKFRDFFVAFDEKVDVSSVFRPRTHPLLTEFETKLGKKYVWTTFSADQADLNYKNPEVLLEMIRILQFYIKNGAKIIRMDANGYMYKELGTSCLNLKEDHVFIKLFRNIIDMAAPDVKLITETNVPHHDNIAYFGDGDEAHMVYNFTLGPLLLHSFLKGSAKKLTEWASTLSNPKGTAFYNFTASHDGIGLTPLKGLVDDYDIKELIKHTIDSGGKVSYRDVPGKEPVAYELNIVYLDALGSPEALIASQAIQLALRGVPAIYFNTLIGAKNWSKGAESANRMINEEKFDFNKLSTEIDGSRIYSSLTKLIEIRSNEQMFAPDVDQEILDLHDSVFALRRNQLIALTNITNKTVAIDLSEYMDKAIDIITGSVHNTKLELKPYDILWLKHTTT